MPLLPCKPFGIFMGLVVVSLPTPIWAKTEAVLIAQIEPDSSLGTDASVVTPEVLLRGELADEIRGGAIRGNNLFHSFAEFNVLPDQRVYFANPIGIENILSRVTGGNLSNIDGLLGVDGAANLYLLNPNGIIFGPNARLDIEGSFTATTADQIGFNDGSEFSAVPTDNELLTVSVPLGVQFNDEPQGDITQQGDLAVGAGASLTLFGDRVLSSGALTVEGGTVQLLGNQVGLVDEAAVDVSSATGGGTVLIGGDYLGEGTVPNANTTLIEAGATIHADAQQTGDGGRVIVWADGATQFAGGISAQGGNESGNGGFVEVSGRQALDFTGTVNTQAVNGIVGQLLLDPANIFIADAPPPGSITVGLGDGVFADLIYAATEDPEQNSHLTPATVEALLAANDLTLVADNAIAVLNNVTANSDNNLTLNAGAIGVIGAVLRQSGGGSIILGTPQTPGNGVAVGLGIVDTSPLPGSTNAGGNVQITTHDLAVLNNGSVSASTLGTGDTGQVQIDATGDVIVDGPSAAIANIVFPGATGDSGGIALSANRLSVLNGAEVNASNFGDGDAGQVQITATGDVLVDGPGSRIASQVNLGATGNSGGIVLSTNNLSLLNDAEVSASTFSAGNAGQVEIDAMGDVIVDGARIDSTVAAGATGDSGGIVLSTTNLEVLNEALLITNTFGDGNAGQVQIEATGNVRVDGTNAAIASQVGSGTTGNGGGILILTNNLSVLNDAAVSAGTFGAGNAGQVAITATGDVLVNADAVIDSSVSPGGTGDSNGIVLSADNLSVLNGSALNASTVGDGNAGRVEINVTEDIRLVDGLIGSAVLPGATGDSGGIVLSTNNLTLLNAAEINTSTGGEGNAGSIAITATGDVSVDGVESFIASVVFFDATGESEGIVLSTNALNVSNGGFVSADTFAQGSAGNILIRSLPVGNLDIALNGGQIRARTQSASPGGNLTLQTAGDLTVQGPGEISVESLDANSGAAGTLNVLANNNVVLDDGVELSAQTAAVTGGGTVNFGVGDALALRRGSFINAESTNPDSGDGGNIFIDTSFLVSVPGENNDIIANAIGGDGGRVEVNAVNIFGFSERQGLTTNELRANTTNDLSASSAQGIEGEITLNTLNLDPSSGLGTLPEAPIDASQLIAQTLCEVGQGSNFVVTGRGGLPSAPADALGAVTPWEDWNFAENTALDLPAAALEIEATDPAALPLVEAQGAMRAEDGRIVLSTEAAAVTPTASPPLSQSCRPVPPVAPSSDRAPTPSSSDEDTP